MNAKTVAIALGALGAGIAAVYAFGAWQEGSRREGASEGKLAEARDLLDAAAKDPTSAGAADLRSRAARVAQEVIDASPSKASAAWRLRGEAMLSSTRFAEAARSFDRALEGRFDPDTALLAGQAYERAYGTGHKGADLASAFAHYERAAEGGAGAAAWVRAARLAASAGRGVELAQYAERLEKVAPGSAEAEEVRALVEAKPSGEKR
ncbi:MAG TPA: hypothetical protein VKE69_11400 [Planctomycetota bacterium]|nr:hypothetical protein [Planctomycetota bacterium]